MENLFFFSYYWLQQNFCSGHSHRLGTFAATLQVRCEAVFVWATHGVCVLWGQDWLCLGLVLCVAPWPPELCSRTKQQQRL